MPKKSKYQLDTWYNLKVPVVIAERLIEKYGKDNWSEAARDILDKEKNNGGTKK
jgi:hypothetical protein